MRVYIAGPISFGGKLLNDWAAIEENMARFKKAAAWLEQQGHEPADPTTTEGDQSWTWRQWMIPALRLLIEADAIALLPGWERSRGAVVEFNLANALGHQIIDLPSEAIS